MHARFNGAPARGLEVLLVSDMIEPQNPSSSVTDCATGHDRPKPVPLLRPGFVKGDEAPVEAEFCAYLRAADGQVQTGVKWLDVVAPRGAPRPLYAEVK